MTYVYTLTNEDLKVMGLEGTGADEYSINQSGWDGRFNKLEEWHKHEYESYKGGTFWGMKRGNVIVNGDELTEDQKEYIIKKM